MSIVFFFCSLVTKYNMFLPVKSMTSGSYSSFTLEKHEYFANPRQVVSIGLYLLLRIEDCEIYIIPGEYEKPKVSLTV